MICFCILKIQTRGKNLMEQPKNYDELCTLVGTVDKSAEEYMRGDAKLLERFASHWLLHACFQFRLTPQGVKFWADIMQKIGQEI